MFEALTNVAHAAAARDRINEYFDEHTEWFYSLSDGNAHAVRRNELAIELIQRALDSFLLDGARHPLMARSRVGLVGRETSAPGFTPNRCRADGY